MPRLPAAVWMALAVLAFSLMPLVVVRGGAGAAPWLFNAAWRAGVAVGVAAFLLLVFPDVARAWASWRAGLRALWTPWVVPAVANCFTTVAFAAATVRVDPAVAAVLYEVWPLPLVLLLGAAYRGTGRYHRVRASLWVCLVLAFAGVVAVVASQRGALPLPSGSGAVVWAGAAFALLSAALTALTVASLRIGTALAPLLPVAAPSARELAGVLLAGLLSMLPAVPISALAGAWRAETLSFPSVVWAFAGGLLTGAGATVAWRQATLVSRHLGIQAMACCIPVLSVLWLALLHGVRVARWDWLVLGAAAVVVAAALARRR